VSPPADVLEIAGILADLERWIIQYAT